MQDLEQIKEQISRECYCKALDMLLDDKNIANYTKENIDNNLLKISKLIQIYNANGRYNDTIKLYNKYRIYIPKNNFFLANKFLSEYELSSGKIILTSRPRNMLVELSTLCNLDCIMCIQREKEKKITTINSHFVNIVIENLPYLEKLMWQGGEVFILSKFKDILLKTLNFPYLCQTITSNFQNIDDETFELLTNNNINLSVSIDGSNKETYEKIRVGASFDKLINNLEKLLVYNNKNKSKLKLQINFVVMKYNYKEIVEMIDIAKRYNAKSIVFLQCTGKKNLDVENTEISLAQQYLIKAEEKCKSSNIEFTSLFALPSRNPYRGSNYVCNQQEQSSNKIDNTLKEELSFFCHIPWYELTFFSNNTISVDCSCDISYPFDIDKNTTIYDIWNSEKIQETRNIVMNNNINKGCKTKCGVTSLKMRKPFSF